jgi:hypothetical protein
VNPYFRIQRKQGDATSSGTASKKSSVMQQQHKIIMNTDNAAVMQ